MKKCFGYWFSSNYPYVVLNDPDGGLVQNLPFGSGTVSLLIMLVISILLHWSVTLSPALFDYLDGSIL